MCVYIYMRMICLVYGKINLSKYIYIDIDIYIFFFQFDVNPGSTDMLGEKLKMSLKKGGDLSAIWR